MSTTTRTAQPAQRDWLPEAGIAAGVAAIGLVTVFRGYPTLPGVLTDLVIVLGMAAAAGLYRRAPGAALGLVWFTCGWQVVLGESVMLVEAATMLVAFGTARYGSTTVLWISGLSIPASAGVLALLRYDLHLGFAAAYGVSALVSRGDTLLLGMLLVFSLGIGVLAVPWLVGLLLRSRQTTRMSQEVSQVAESEREGALEIARLRAQQTRLANDVHDVVGHSLAVILAQAESAQFLPDDDSVRIKETLANIATSARESLRDVRQVLEETEERRTTPPAGGLDSLIEGVRAAGNEVDSVVVGTPRPLPPELDAVAFRVLQEMLTNALKHGRRGEPVGVERHWDGDDLRIEVRNVVGDQASSGPGLGVEGMRHRLASVGGRLDVRRRTDAPGVTFTATAWVPLRPVAHG